MTVKQDSVDTNLKWWRVEFKGTEILSVTEAPGAGADIGFTYVQAETAEAAKREIFLQVSRAEKQRRFAEADALASREEIEAATELRVLLEVKHAFETTFNIRRFADWLGARVRNLKTQMPQTKGDT